MFKVGRGLGVVGVRGCFEKSPPWLLTHESSFMLGAECSSHSFTSSSSSPRIFLWWEVPNSSREACYMYAADDCQSILNKQMPINSKSTHPVICHLVGGMSLHKFRKTFPAGRRRPDSQAGQQLVYPAYSVTTLRVSQDAIRSTIYGYTSLPT